MMKNILKQSIWRFYDQSTSAIMRSPLESFATDDTLCQIVGQGQSAPVVRTWVHDASVVLGIQDHRLPHVLEGMAELEKQGYHPIVRNSGGLAVVLDRGVLNISIVLSEQEHSLDINSGYDVMVELVKKIFPEVSEQIEAYEIVGSYCPGTYDLSIGGKKFAGISQRRLRQGVAIQVYLCVEGSGSERAKLIRDFYKVSLKGEETKFIYPTVIPDVITSLSELLGLELTVQQVVLRLQQVLEELATEEVQMLPLQESEMELYTFYLKRVFNRNAKMLEKESDTR